MPRIEGPPPPNIPKMPESPDASKKSEGAHMDWGIPGMTDEQNKQATNTFLNDVGRALNHYANRALEALRELKKSFMEED